MKTLKNLAGWRGKMSKDFIHRDYDEIAQKYKYVSYNVAAQTIDIIGLDGAFKYWVDLDRCKTAGECLDWIHQLHAKSWFNAEMEKEFIDILFKLIPSNLWSAGGN
jgi:hypothetical protein